MKIAGAILLTCVFSCLRSQNPFHRVRLFLDTDQQSAAEKLLDSCERKHYMPDSVYYFRVIGELRAGRTRQAKKIWNKLSAGYPGFGDLHFVRGLIAYTESNYGRSIDDFTKALQANPAHPKALYNRALAYGMLDDYALAIADLDSLIRISPENAGAYYSRAYWFEFQKKYAEAAKDYEQVLKYDPKNFDAYYGLAFSYRNLGDAEKACDTVNRAIAAGSQIAEELKENYCR